MTEPTIIGVRHHSPACARLVADRIRRIRPAHVLIEGPADVNDRIDEFHLGHQLPIAVHSYLSTPDVHRTSWAPFAEHSPEWQALVEGRATGAQVRFIDLPAWHDAFADVENRFADAVDADELARATAWTARIAEETSIEGVDALWDHLFESLVDGPETANLDELDARLDQWFRGLRGDAPGTTSDRSREAFMAQWIAWAVATGEGPVVVVCGGFHAPALARMWREVPDAETSRQPAVVSPPGADDPDVRHGSFLIPYSFHRLDAFTGYASGMPSPGYYQWLWELGAAGAGERMLREVRTRLRAKKLPTSTATLIAVHTHAHGLARLRGHDAPLRVDWLDAMAASWVTDSLDAPLPWSYRGTLRPGTAPVLVEMMSAITGTASGTLAPETPQPPLLASLEAGLAAHDIPERGELDLDLLDPADVDRSVILHRMRILGIPGIQRAQTPGEATERWVIRRDRMRLPALIEAGAWGGTLLDAARAKWADSVGRLAGDVDLLADALRDAVQARLDRFTPDVLRRLADAVATETDLGALGAALRGLLPMLRGMAPDAGMREAIVATVSSMTDRALWLFEFPATLHPNEERPHIMFVVALRDVVRLQRSFPADGDGRVALDVPESRITGVLARKVTQRNADPASRGAALGALISLDGRERTQTDPAHPEHDAQTGPAHPEPDAHAHTATPPLEPFALLAQLPVDRFGNALAGLLALARHDLLDASFVAGLDDVIASMDGDDFVAALPALRFAFAWLPPRERGALAERVLALHGASQLSARALTGAVAYAPQSIAAARQAEADAIAMLQRWGLWREERV